jgi:hypothetical protein
MAELLPGRTTPRSLPIQLDGPRQLLIDAAAIRLATEQFGMFKNSTPLECPVDLAFTQQMIWAGLQRGGTPLRLKIVRRLITQDNYERFGFLVIKAICIGIRHHNEGGPLEEVSNG